MLDGAASLRLTVLRPDADGAGGFADRASPALALYRLCPRRDRSDTDVIFNWQTSHPMRQFAHAKATSSNHGSRQSVQRYAAAGTDCVGLHQRLGLPQGGEPSSAVARSFGRRTVLRRAHDRLDAAPGHGHHERKAGLTTSLASFAGRCCFLTLDGAASSRLTVLLPHGGRCCFLTLDGAGFLRWTVRLPHAGRCCGFLTLDGAAF